MNLVKHHSFYESKSLDDLYEELVKKVLKYNASLNKNRFKKAFNLAVEAHRGQFRDSGEPYVTHPLYVALILTEYYVDEETLIAALLHDVIEDNDEVDFELIEEKFGKIVGELVEGVTKIKKFMPKKKEMEIETIRKIFKKADEDIRVLLIKLADRLHNMQTLESKKEPSKRIRKAKESLNIFVQMAARLGIWSMKRSLENLIVPYLFSKDYKYIESFLKKEKNRRLTILNEAVKCLKKSDNDNLIVDTSFYHRGMLALRTALTEKNRLTINDNLVIQLMAKDEDSCYLVLRLIYTLWNNTAREQDFISNPRDNGYQAYHTEVITREGYRIKIRVMTPEMQLRNWYGVTYDYFQKKEAKIGKFFKAFGEIDQGTIGESEKFLEAAKTDLLEEKIKIHTKGRSLDVPSSSTVLDFAFYCFGIEALRAKHLILNDREVFFGTSLKDGDLVEIVFSEHQNVKFDWLYLVQTATSRIIIQNALKKGESAKKIAIGRKLLQKEFDLYEKGVMEGFFIKSKGVLEKSFNVVDENELFILLAEGTVSSYEVFLICFPKTKQFFSRKFFSKIALKLRKFFNFSSKEHIRLKIEGVMDKSLDVVHEIHKIRQKFDIILVKSVLRENSYANIFTLKLNCSARKIKDFHYFFLELQRQPGIISMQPLMSAAKQKVFVLWSILTFFIWGALSFFFSFLADYYESIPLAFFAYSNLFLILIVNYLLYSFVRNYFPQIRNSIWLFILALFLNLLGVTVFISQLMIHSYDVDLYVVSGIFFSLNFLFLYHYIIDNVMVFRKTKKRKKIIYKIRKWKAWFSSLFLLFFD